jgi:hypothetical protein
VPQAIGMSILPYIVLFGPTEEWEWPLPQGGVEPGTSLPRAGLWDILWKISATFFWHTARPGRGSPSSFSIVFKANLVPVLNTARPGPLINLT